MWHGGHDHSHGEEHDHHGHHHGHGHSHAPATFGKAFAIGICLNFGFVVVEVVYGLLSHSLALVADAGHNLSDVFGLLLAWGAILWAKRAPTDRHTYGWRRSSILAALGNAVFLLLSVGVIAWEAALRLRAPVPIATHTMIWVAALGILINGSTAALFMAGRKGDLNVRAAFQHMAADALLSAGVVAAGLAIGWTGWLWLDPAMSLVLSATIIAGTWRTLHESFDLALDCVPSGIETEAVAHYLESLPGVADVHHLHIWGLSTTDSALTAHITLTEGATNNALLRMINEGLEEHFSIGHATIQFEQAGTTCCKREQCAGGEIEHGHDHSHAHHGHNNFD